MSFTECLKRGAVLSPPVYRQLFEERMRLVLHWFDLWTDTQRKHLMHALLTRCSRSQLKYVFLLLPLFP